MTIKCIEILFQKVRKIIALFTSIPIMNINYHGEQDVTDILPNSTCNFLQLNNNTLLRKGYFGLWAIIINKPIICLKTKTNHIEFLLLGSPGCKEITFQPLQKLDYPSACNIYCAMTVMLKNLYNPIQKLFMCNYYLQSQI